MQGDSRGWSALDSRDNALNAIRLALAVLVLVGHTYPIGYGTPAPVEHIAGYAVDGFFVISGFLVANSRDRLPFREFMRRRALRIFPGLWACLAVTAFLIAPVMAGSSFADGLGYVARNFLLQSGAAGVGETPTGVPIPGQWNGSLWTLSYEFGCYVGLGVLWFLGRHRTAAVGGVFVACTALLTVRPQLVTDTFAVQHAVRLAAFFAAGALLAVARDRIPASGRVAALAAATVVVSAGVGLGFYWAVAPLPLAYLLLRAGATLPVRAGSRNDVSYGMYLYAFPVQQSLAIAGVAAAPPLVFICLTVCVTLPLAWASWLWVERPALRLAKRRPAIVTQGPSSRRGPTSPRRPSRVVSP